MAMRALLAMRGGWRRWEPHSNGCRRPTVSTPPTPHSTATARVIVEGSSNAEIVARVNDEVEAAVAAADPDEPVFDPVLAGVPRPVHEAGRECPRDLAHLRDRRDVQPAPARALRPGAAPRRAPRYQLNLGHLLQRGPGASEQMLHRDEAVWSDVPRPEPELQLASVIAFVDFTRENGATRVVPGSHRWPDRALPVVRADPPARSRARPDRVRRDAGRVRGRLPRRHAARGRRQHDRHPASRRAPELLPRLAADRGEPVPLGAAGGRGDASRAAPRSSSATGAQQHPAGRRLPRDGPDAGPHRAVAPDGSAAR